MKQIVNKKSSSGAEQNVPHFYVELIKELNRSFDFFNKHFTNGMLERPVITVAAAGRRRAYGWFGADHWKTENKVLHEINLSAESIDRSIDDLLETLLHEMAHQWNRQNGIRDVVGHQRHNGMFAKSAQGFGLKVEKMGNYGMAKTSLADDAKKAIHLLQPNEEVYKLSRNLIKVPKGDDDDSKGKFTTVLIDKDLKGAIESCKAGLEGASQKDVMNVSVNLLNDILQGKVLVIDAETKKAIDVKEVYLDKK